VIAVGVAVSGYGLLEKMSYDSCLELIRAFERGESSVLPGCPADDSAGFFFVGSSVIGIGILVLLLGMKNAAIVEKIFGRSE